MAKRCIECYWCRSINCPTPFQIFPRFDDCFSAIHEMDLLFKDLERLVDDNRYEFDDDEKY